MSLDATIDTSKSLAELTGTDWGAAPNDARELVRERHELHRTPVRDLSDLAVARLLDMGVGGEFLVPVAVERLHADPERMSLLCAVRRDDTFSWRSRPKNLAALREIVHSAANQLSQIKDDLERLGYEAAMWR